MAKDYKDTLNLPATEFPMRAGLPVKEPETLKRWESENLYEKMLAHNADKPLFVLHDGPPFSNGNIHMGHALNKILKDIINKSKSMGGFKVPFIPGWDNHGMPIESAIIKQSKLDRNKMTISEFRSKCQDFAQNFVELHKASFKRLGVFGDWENSYLTMRPSFEAKEIRIFGKMYEQGYIFKNLKPVYWCAHDETALAEAEIEYKDDPCTSIYVKFAVNNDNGFFGDTTNTYFIIWTTTPWTLPGNLAIAVHPRDEYCLVSASDGNRYIVATALCDKTLKSGGIEKVEILKTFPGGALEGMTARHPFLDRDSLLVTAEYVTMDSGTGCVHTAPGFGADDYVTGMRYHLPILVPVDDKGYQTEEAGPYVGMRYDISNTKIVEDMKESGALFASEVFTHSYPHCWRCGNPIIFRATPQWFCSVSKFRDEAIEACKHVQWMPEWGGERIVSMIKERADWCISRQRHWGLPIPVFYCDCGEIICNSETIDSVAKIFEEKGSNAWFEMSAEELLPHGFKCPKCGGTHFVKETDTLDGWFDSGCTHFDVLENNPDMHWPADLYLEGGDQYRGWFQSSLLTAVAAKHSGAPYKAVLTNGWTVDGEGRIMHKSLGNGVDPQDIIKQYGADIIRLWVAASDYTVDVHTSNAIFKQLSESYRKIRNTVRILLANLNDFDPKRDMVPVDQLADLDKWALSRLNNLVRDARASYDRYQFHIVYHDIHNFCSIDLSKLYIDITKDRLYCEAKDSVSRRAAQTVMYLVADDLIRLIAPILAFTSEEAWGYLPHRDTDNAESVFLNDLPSFRDEYSFKAIEDKYEAMFAYRDDVMKALELARADKKIGKSLDAHVVIYGAADNDAMKHFAEFASELPEIFMTSGATLSNDAAPATAFAETEHGIAVDVLPAKGEKCVRCWISTEHPEHDENGQVLCARCKKALSC